MSSRRERLSDQQPLDPYRDWLISQEAKVEAARKREEKREEGARILHKIGYITRLLIATFLFGVSLALFLINVLIIKDLIGLVPTAFIFWVAYSIWPKKERKR